ncbi:sensor histidine kinase [Campylobacter sputorum]|uniref:sensor histidine kinase n=1 Tax=Campylobacter sputorum TaxID=206 RepID=UPI00053BF4B6|nr:HAMP domain-containing sensor histidine kinase [Campylobacter sputorum]
MSHKKHFLPIFFALYDYKHCIFIYILYFLYKFYYSEIIKEANLELRNHTNEIFSAIRMDLNLNDILETLKEHEINANIQDNIENKFILKEFDIPNLQDDNIQNEKYKIYFLDDVTYMKTKFFYRLRPMSIHNPKSFTITLKTQKYAKLISSFVVKLIIGFAGIFFIFLFISYFIIKLSFKPLLLHIEQLNSFIKDTTHEVNTPLCIILMSIEMFQSDPKKYLNNIKTASKTLSNLYNDLVFLTLKSPKNEPKELNLKEIIKTRIDYFEVMAEQNSLKIEQNLKEVLLKTDENKFKMIFDNILNNAIKYASKDSIIKVNLDNNGFSITNFGEEISKENLEKIYDKFTRFNQNRGGFGIGLSLVKKFADELNFIVRCESSNKITTFSVKFA